MTTPSRPLRIESLFDTGQGGIGARLMGLPAEVRQLHREVFLAFLATGQGPHRDALPQVGGVGRDQVFRQLSDADLVQLNADGYVMVAYPFSGRPTGHVVQLEEATVVSAMCAIDALGIPLMTGGDAVIVSTDPSDGHPICIERRSEAWRWEPEDTAVLVAQSSGWGPAATCLCPAITFHTSRHRAEDYLRRRAELTGWVLDQAQAVEIAWLSFGSLLESDAHTASPAPPASMRGPTMTVEMLHTEGCPHAADYLPRLRQLLAGAAVAQPVQVRAITDPNEAQCERFLGSPTIRVNGRDVDPTADRRRDYGLCCRLYPGPDGLRGTPSDEWVLALLRPDPADPPGPLRRT
ncbi:MAG: DF family (seleno)protein [Pseudonocardiaceae bacterium]